MRRPGIDPLLPGLAAGDERAFDALYDRFATRLYRAALGMLGRVEDAEDTVQDVFLAVVRSRRSLSGVGDLTAYLFAALRRAAARRAVLRAREPAGSDAAIRDASTAAGRHRGDDPRSERLGRAFRVLPAKQREVVVLKIDGELTFAEIAQVLDVSINTAASRYRYALEKLRKALGAADYTPAPEE